MWDVLLCPHGGSQGTLLKVSHPAKSPVLVQGVEVTAGVEARVGPVGWRRPADIEVTAWRHGRLGRGRFRGWWLIEPMPDEGGAATRPAGDADWAVGIDEDGWWIFYRHFPCGGGLPPLLTLCPTAETALSQGVPQVVVERALEALSRRS